MVGAGGNATLGSTAGLINAGTINASGAVLATAATSLTAGTTTAGRNIALTGQSINAATLTAGTNIAATSASTATIGDARATGGNATLAAIGALSATNVGALGDVLLTSRDGTVTTGTLSSGSAFTGGTTGGAPGAGDIIINAARDVVMNGNGNAGRNLNVTAGNQIAINAIANGAAIDLRSIDIAVNTAAGRIGQQGRTTLARLTNSGTGVTTIGGTGGTGGYGLSNAEAQRIFAGDIIITSTRGAGTQVPAALGIGTPDVVLDTLTLTGANGQTGATAGNIGTSGRFRIETPGGLKTVGAVSLTNMSDANRFQINAARSIEIDPATGSISLAGTGSALGGTIELSAPSVIVATSQAITDVAAATGGRAVNDRLAINDGAINDVGNLSASGIIVNVTNDFLVQNTGIKMVNALSFDDRRGVTVGAGGLQITTASPTTRIFVSGRRVLTTGTFAVGLEFLRQSSVNGVLVSMSTFPPTPFNVLSTINGCTVGNIGACFPDGGSLARDAVGQSDDNANVGVDSSFLQFQFKTMDETRFEQVIEDPVTGVGNDDLLIDAPITGVGNDALSDEADCTSDSTSERCSGAPK